MSDSFGPPQIVVVYADGSPFGAVYDTAYDVEQAKRAVVRCVRKYGRRANVRTEPAKEHFRKVAPRKRLPPW